MAIRAGVPTTGAMVALFLLVMPTPQAIAEDLVTGTDDGSGPIVHESSDTLAVQDYAALSPVVVEMRARRSIVLRTGIQIQSGASVSFIISNQAPWAADDVLTAGAARTDEPIAFALQGGDADGDPITFAVTDPPANGSLSGTAPDLVFTPGADNIDQMVLGYAVSDGLVSTQGSFTIDFAPNAPPVAEAQSLAVVQDTPLGLTLAASDADQDPLRFRIVTPPSHGELLAPVDAEGLLLNRQLAYVPAAGYTGADSFVFAADDGHASGTATVELAVAAPVVSTRNDGYPNDSLLIDPGQGYYRSAAQGVLANDSGAVSAVVSRQAQHGTLVLNADGSFTYTADAGFQGKDFFSYTAQASSGETAQGQVVLDVHSGLATTDSDWVPDLGFNRQSWTDGSQTGLDYRSGYLGAVVPGRIWHTSTDAADPVLTAVNDRHATMPMGYGKLLRVDAGGTVNGFHRPVTFHCTTDGRFQANDRNTITVQATADGSIAESVFIPGSPGRHVVIAASPMARERVRFIIQVTE